VDAFLSELKMHFHASWGYRQPTDADSQSAKRANTQLVTPHRFEYCQINGKRRKGRAPQRKIFDAICPNGMPRFQNTETQKWFPLPYVRSKKIDWRISIARQL
jgi:hypothetical protein